MIILTIATRNTKKIKKKIQHMMELPIAKMICHQLMLSLFMSFSWPMT